MARRESYGGNEYDSASNPPIPRLSGVPYLCRYVNEPMPRTPAASQGPSDAELNAIPPDPFLPRFGGNTLAINVMNLGMMSPLGTVGDSPDRSRVMISTHRRR